MEGEAERDADEAIRRAMAARPRLGVSFEDFAAYAASRRGEGTVAALHLGDLYLACACGRGIAPAVAELEAAFLAPLEGVVSRVGVSAHVGSDVLQILRERLLVGAGRPRIGDYTGRGSLAGWLRIAAVREASRLRRDEMARARVAPPSPPPEPSPELGVLRGRYAKPFADAFGGAFRSLPAEERLALRLHFADGLNLDRLAVALGCSRATAGRRLLSARARLRESTLRLLGERLDLPAEEVQSVVKLLGSELEVSIGALVTSLPA